MALVLLKTFDSAIEASLARSFLESEGIMCFLFDVEENMTNYPRISIPVRLMVPEEDFEDAVLQLRGIDENHAKSGAS